MHPNQISKEDSITSYTNFDSLFTSIQTEIKAIRAILKQLPNGQLYCAKNGPYTKWYRRTEHAPIYIPKGETQLLEKLTARKYYSLLLQELTDSQKLLEKYFIRQQKKKIRSSDLLKEDSPYCKLLNSHFYSLSKELQQWCSKPYNQNSFHPEHLIHKTLSGHLVRSKSEVIIANMLYKNKIPYRYECELVIEEMSYYPDFTILHPKTKELFYWEHFGMMDKFSYRNHNFEKLKVYGSQGILPDINLIITYETASVPIDSGRIERIIQEYFL